MKLFALITGLTLSIALVQAAEPNTVPPLASIDEIGIGAPSGWWLRITIDGSGVIGYGAGAKAKFPIGTFDFAKLHKDLAPVVHFEGNMSDFFTVAFHKRGATTTQALYTKSSVSIIPLYKTAQQNWVLLGNEHVQKAWQTHPPKSLE